MVTFPFCKINLGLRVVRKRTDGYHDIETVFYPVPWCDVLEVIPATEISFALTGLPVEGNAGDNLCMKAYRALARDFSLPPVQVHLHKTIPTGAGLGGGSSDAAHMLLLLNDRFECNLGMDQLTRYASTIGSDCAYFIHRQAMLGTGRGEVLSPAPISLKGKFLVLVKPNVHVSTAEAYAGITPAEPLEPLLPLLQSTPFEHWRDTIRNDFEGPVMNRFPVIADLKTKLYKCGAVYVAMSGSGSAVFGMFQEPVDLRSLFGDLTYWSGTLSF